MRPIDEIIKELESHPDYITSQIFTWSEFLENINDSNSGRIELSDLSEDLKENIEDYIQNVLYEYTYLTSSPYPSLVKNDNDEWGIENDQYF